MQIIKYDDKNIFHQIIKEKLNCDKLYEDDYSVAFYDINPKAKIHVLVIPKGCYTCSQDFFGNGSDIEITSYYRAIAAIVKLIPIVDGYRLISNCGRDSNQEVQHFHTHILAGENLGNLR